MKVIVTVTAGPAQGRTFTFEEPDCFLFGRTKDARVSLPNDPYVSRQHFLLEIAPATCRVTDLESKNGTFVNGLRYGGRKAPEPGMRTAPGGATECRLSNNDEIVVGDTRMRVVIHAPSTSDTTVDVEDDDGSTKTIREESVPAAALKQNAIPTVKDSVPPAPLPPHPADPMISAMKTIVEPLAEQQTVVADGPESDSARMAPAGEVEDLLELDDAPPIPGYRLTAVLGQGGMGKVYKGIDLRNGREVAIKALIPQVSMSFNNYRAFHREIEVTRQLFHPNIVEFIGVGKVKGAYFCVLEFVKGMDLRKYVSSRGGKLNLPEAVPLILGTLAGLGYAHRKAIMMQGTGRTNVFKGIVHRDLKPENILLQQSGTAWVPKVADFGLSKSYESAGMTDMTMAGVAGTPAYWPREQITHYRFLHPATDVFSIAAVFYEVLTGEWARPGLKQRLDNCRNAGRVPQISDYIRIIGDNPIKPIRELNPSIPPLVAEVFDRALRETEVPVDESEMRRILTELRYRDASVFHDVLVQALKDSGYNI
jgi:serine/threonine protein kinase